MDHYRGCRKKMRLLSARRCGNTTMLFVFFLAAAAIRWNNSIADAFSFQQPERRKQQGQHCCCPDDPLFSPAVLPKRRTPTCLLGRRGSEECDDDNTNSNNNKNDDDGQEDKAMDSCNRRSLLKHATAAAVSSSVFAATTAPPLPAGAEITPDSEWPLWPALPVAPYSRRKTLRKEIVPGRVWTFDQLIGIYYVQVPIRMTVVAMEKEGGSGGLLVYAPVAPTRECRSLLQPLIDEFGEIRYILLPSVAVEHKVNAGPFARAYPGAELLIVDRQYSFPVPLPNEFLGLPSRAKPLPESGTLGSNGEFEFRTLTVKPGPGSMYQDVALFHGPTKTLLVCDAVLSVTPEPPDILTVEPEYTRALLFHARDSKDEPVPDTPENRRKGWRRIVLLFNFFFPRSGRADLGPGPVLQALKTPTYEYGWGGWMPFSWTNESSELLEFERYSGNGKPTIYTVVQIILSRGPPENVQRWVDDVTTRWDFERVVPAHLDAPINIRPKEFAETFGFLKTPGTNEVRYCDESVQFLRGAEEGFLSFSVYPTTLGPLRGREGPCGL